MMKILIVSAFFPPMNSIASERPTSWAKHWSRAGHDVTVLTVARPADASDALPSFPHPEDTFKILRTPLPRPFWVRMLLGNVMPNTSSSTQLSSTRLNPERGVRRILRNFLNEGRRRYGFMSVIRMPDVHDLWAAEASALVSSTRWDVVVSTGGPYSVHFVGQHLKRRNMARIWCVDWRDLWTRNNLFPGLPLVRSIERRIEASFHRDADLITTVSDPLAETLRSMCDKTVETIYNGFEPDDSRKLPPGSIFPADGIFRVAYTGTLYPMQQDPTPFFKALAQLHRDGLIHPRRFEVVTAGACERLLELAEAHGVREYVHFRGMLPRAEALRVQRDAQALLLIGFQGAGHEGVLTGKIFEYLAAGPPVLAVTFDADSSVGALLRHTQRGAALGDSPAAIAAVLRNWMAQPYAHAPNAHSEFNERVAFFTRERQAMRMLSLIEDHP